MKTLTLWHGTTQSAAERIIAQGFEPTDTARIVGAVAQEHGLAAADLFEMLLSAGRFAVIQHRRDDAVWFATSKEDAAKWAQRAPEVRWEALWAAWWLTNGGFELVPSPWLDPTAAAWHTRQFFADPPAVVEVRVPSDRIQDAHQEPVPLQSAVEATQMGTPELSVAHPIPAEWVVGYEVLPREVEFTPAAGILGLEIAELGRRVDAGEIIPCRPPKEKYGCDWYWHLDEFLTFMPHDAEPSQ